MKPIARVLFIAGLFASALTATAQINVINARQYDQLAESLYLGLTAYSSGTFYQNVCQWTSPSAPASLSTGNTMTGGVYDGFNFSGGAPYLYSSGNNMSNAGARGVIRGKNKNGGIRASTLVVICGSTNAVTLQIWGNTTLSGLGITGATNFRWEVYAGSGSNPYSNFGNGEATFTIPQSKMASGQAVVFFYTTDDDENGSVMANFYN